MAYLVLLVLLVPWAVLARLVLLEAQQVLALFLVPAERVVAEGHLVAEGRLASAEKLVWAVLVDLAALAALVVMRFVRTPLLV